MTAEPAAAVDPAAQVSVCRAALMVFVRTDYQNPTDRDRVLLSPC